MRQMRATARRPAYFSPLNIRVDLPGTRIAHIELPFCIQAMPVPNNFDDIANVLNRIFVVQPVMV